MKDKSKRNTNNEDVADRKEAIANERSQKEHSSDGNHNDDSDDDEKHSASTDRGLKLSTVQSKQ